MRQHRLPMGPKPRPIAERFAEKFHRREPHECWVWIGQVNRNDRGVFYWDANKKMVLAPRAALWLAGIPLPADKLACHTCDNKRCVNPGHIYVGTAKQNVRDAIERGQRVQHGPKGMQHAQASIRDQDVYEIRRRLKAGERGSDIARAIGITKTVVSLIKTGKTWKHLA